jgi:uncharacterized membrane protein HdeD (DUF308 family)
VSAAYDAQRALRGLTSHLGVFSALAAVIVGAMLLFQPRITTEFLILALAAFLLVKSVIAIVDASRERNDMWAWRVLAGVIGIIVALIVLAEPVASAVITLAVAYYILAIGLAIVGMLEIANGLRAAPRDWVAVTIGAIEIVLAFMILFNPLTGVVIMIQVIGALALTMGVLLFVNAVSRT